MAEASIPVEQLTCPVCLDLLNDPVTIPCGHSYCMSCINACWDRTGVYSCPHCRRVFTPRPDLGKNIILTDMIEKLKQIQLQAAHPAHSYAGHGYVCDMCIGRKDKAVKSCLMCLKSYCHAHFEHHKMVYSGKAHEVIDATRLQENICRQHNKQLDVFCRTDQHLICSLCTRDEHKNHNTVPAVAERTEKQRFQSDEDVGKPLKVLELKSKTVPRPRPSSVAFQSSAYTPATSKPQVWPPTPLKPRPRPSSIALNTGASTLPKSWAKSTTPSEPQSRPNIESVFHRYGLTPSKPTFVTVTAESESKRRSIMLPSESRTSTVPKPRPRPSSVALNTGASTLPKSWAKSTTSSEPQSRPNIESVFQRYGLTPSKPTFVTVTAESESKRTSIMLPSESRTSTAPETSPRTSTAPESRSGTSTAPDSRLGTSTAPDSRLGTYTVPKLGTVTSRTDVAPTTPKTPKSWPRTSTVPESQVRTSIAPKFGIVISRTRIPPESRHRPMMAPKPEPTYSTAPESQHNHDLIKELKSKLKAKKQYVP